VEPGIFRRQDLLFLCVVFQDEIVLTLTAPHSNQFLDPLLLIKNVRRRVGFLCAQKSFERKFVGACAKTMEASKFVTGSLWVVPVIRPQDMVKKCSGEVTISGCTVTGMKSKSLFR
jgi:glycerol-3-phosphate O-acyltransferase/dihydroxyacetone phosphate acyltransferase